MHPPRLFSFSQPTRKARRNRIRVAVPPNRRRRNMNLFCRPPSWPPSFFQVREGADSQKPDDNLFGVGAYSWRTEKRSGRPEDCAVFVYTETKLMQLVSTLAARC